MSDPGNAAPAAATAPVCESWHLRVWRLAWPIVLSNVTVPLVGAVDTAIVGHLDGAHLIGGVALGTLIFNYIYWGVGFLRMGTTGIVAQARGAGDAAGARDALIRALVLAVGFGLLCLLLRRLAADFAFTLLSGSPEVEDAARRYFLVRVWAAPAAMCNIAILGCLFGLQAMRSGLLHQFAINLTNIALSLWFVLGLGWGLEGVAQATVAGQYAGLAVGVVLVLRALPPSAVPVRIRAVLDRGPLKAMMAVNADIFIRTVCVLTATAFLMNASARLGDAVLAANAVLLVFHTIVAYGLDAYAHAAEALVGEAVGARSRDRLRAAVRYSSLWAVALAAMFSVALFGLGGVLIDLLTDIESVRLEARAYLPWAAALSVISVASFQLDGIFIGATRSAEMRNAMIVSLAGFMLIGSWLAGALENHGLWLAYAIFMVLRAVTLAAYYPRIERGL